MAVTPGRTKALRPFRWWLIAAVVAATYGVFLTVTALRLPVASPLTGQFGAQPAAKALMAALLAVAALGHPIVRERRWLIGACVFSAAGDFLLALPGWHLSFVLGLAAFLAAHVCFLGALLPLAVPTRNRLALCAVVVAACVVLLGWFWPHLGADGLTIPVTVYMLVLAGMVCAALVADLPTGWTALGAVCFAVSDAMIGIGEFIRTDQLLAVPIWWAYATAMLLITAGFFFGRPHAGSRVATARSAA